MVNQLPRPKLFLDKHQEVRDRTVTDSNDISVPYGDREIKVNGIWVPLRKIEPLLTDFDHDYRSRMRKQHCSLLACVLKTNVNQSCMEAPHY